MKKILCVGSITTDILVKSVDEIPPAGTLRSVDSISTFVGGCASNCAIDLAKLGVPVSLSARVGEDSYGNFVRETSEKYGVDTRGLITKGPAPTTVSVVCVRTSGERSFMYNPGSSSAFCPADVDMQVVRDCDIVFYTAAMLMQSFDGAPCFDFLEECRRLGKYTVMDTGWDFEDIWLPKIEASLPGLDLFLPSYDEAVRLTGKTDPAEIAAFFIDMGVKQVIIKLGKDGAFLYDPAGHHITFPTYSGIKPVDTTGAGDAFCSGMLAGLSMGWDLKRCIPFANAVGTHCIMQPGASTGIPTIADIEQFMATHTCK